MLSSSPALFGGSALRDVPEATFGGGRDAVSGSPQAFGLPGLCSKTEADGASLPDAALARLTGRAEMVRSNATAGVPRFLHHLLRTLGYGLIGAASLLAFLGAALLGSGVFGW